MKPDKDIHDATDDSGTLAEQIKAIEHRIMSRQQGVHARTDILVKDLHRQMTAPATLLLVGGVGFIVGELTKRPPKKERQAAARTDADVTPLKKAVNLMSLLHSFYQALPLVWIMDVLFPEDASKAGVSARGVKKSSNQPV
jgi:hypothetical protein